MRWFKHDTDARNDVRLKLLKKRFGAAGYGVYFQLLEIIGEYVDKDNLKEWGMVDKFHSVETLAEECGVSPDELRKILLYCNELGLLEKKANRLYCEKILKRLDDYAERIHRKTGQGNDEVGSKSELSTESVRTKSDIEQNRIEQNRKEKILNTGDKRPEISKTSQDGKPTTVGDVLAHRKLPEKPVTGSPGLPRNGISTAWQDKGFRYAQQLGIKLTDNLKPRWLKVFKQASEGRKPANLEKAYSYLSDLPEKEAMDQNELVNYFFWIYENGLGSNFFQRKL